MWRPLPHRTRLSKHQPSLPTNLHSVPPFVSSATTIDENFVFLRGFSEKSFASLINRARARPDFARPTSRPTPRCFLHTWPGRAKAQRRRRRARAREAIKPYLFSLWMVGITAKRTAIHRTRRRWRAKTSANSVEQLPLSHVERLETWLAGRLAYPSSGEEMSHEAHLRKTGGRQSRRNEADTQTPSS